MGNYKSADDASKGSPNLEAIQTLQENWDLDTISASVQVSKVTITASGTSGIAAVIPVGAEIIDAKAIATSTVGSGTAQVQVTGGSAITDAMTMAVEDAIATAATIDTTYSVVTADGISVATNGDSDAGYVYIYYKK